MAQCAQQMIETDVPRSAAPEWDGEYVPDMVPPTPGLVQPARCAAMADVASTGANIAGPFSITETCIVFDWDDTLFPSSFVDRKRLLQEYRQFQDLTEELQRLFRELERGISRLLSLAAQYGTVIIITNAQSGWIELCVSKFMPGLLEVLTASVRVVSARSNFERFFPGDPLCWKAAAFAHELHQLQKVR
jgi:hypothetical protein